MKLQKITKGLIIGSCLLYVAVSCTDLDVPVYDRATDFWRTEAEIAAGVAPAYSGLRNYVFPFGIYSLNELSTDEIIVPMRGQDWNDNSVWEVMWKHTWEEDHFLLDIAWNNIYGGGIVRINQILQAVNEIEPVPENLLAIEAELKTVRAFYYYVAMDLWGNVPIDEGDLADQYSRAEVYAFIEKEIKDNIALLPTEVSPRTYGRATQWFANAVLAKLYLNADVYVGADRWDECIAACDAILNAGQFSLEADFFDNFKIDNEGSRESIFSIPFDRVNGLGGFFVHQLSLHYKSNETFGLQWIPFNGFCTEAEFYNLYDPADIRRNSFLVGQQYKDQIVSPLNAQTDGLGNPLDFDPVITSFSIQPPKVETAGARCAKWEINKESPDMSNDFAVFRLSDIILMKAEAQYRNGDAAGALITINQKINGVSIRSRTGIADFSMSEMNLDGLLAERAREFAWEGHRRNDLIRFGRFTEARIPEKSISESFRILYPIPRSVLDNNTKLVQNPGY